MEIKLIKSYLRNLSKEFLKGDAREESYYKHLEKLLLDFSAATTKKKIDITVLPKQTEAGNPDFRIWYLPTGQAGGK